MRHLPGIISLLTLVLLGGCATQVAPPPPAPVATSAQTQETQRLNTLAFQAGALALGHDSMAGVPIDVYRIPSDPDRDAFARTPSRQKTAWEFQIVKVQLEDRCDPAAPPSMGLHLVFADEDTHQAYPLEAQWSLDCRRPVQMPGVFRTPKNIPAWVMFPAPVIDHAVNPPQVHFLTQDEVKATTPGLPLSMASMVVGAPMVLTLRWRSRTAAGSITPWTTQTITVRPTSVFTTASCSALRSAATIEPGLRDAMLANDCGRSPVLPVGLRTVP